MENEIVAVAGSVNAAVKSSGALKAEGSYNVPRENIVVMDGFNVRLNTKDYKAHIRWIADSIKANGFDRTKPLAGHVIKRDGVDMIALTDGHSRLAAVDLAAAEGVVIETLPINLHAKGVSEEDLTVGLVTANSGRRLEALEIATVITRLQGFGWDEKKIAQKIGYSKNHIDNFLLLASAPAGVRKLVMDGKVSATVAIEQLKKNPEKALAVLTKGLEKAKARGKEKLTAKDVKEPKAAAESEPEAAVPSADKFAVTIAAFFEECPTDLLNPGKKVLTAYAEQLAARLIADHFLF